MSKHTVALTVLVEVDDEKWGAEYRMTPQEAVEDSESHLRSVVAAGLGTMASWGVIGNIRIVDLLAWARKRESQEIIGPGDFYAGVAMERDSWTSSLIGILTGGELPE